jgi:hypothetical protein
VTATIQLLLWHDKKIAARKAESESESISSVAQSSDNPLLDVKDFKRKETSGVQEVAL